MARNYQYFVDPKEEERKRLLLEQEFGPPAPDLPNLGTMTRPQITAADIEAAQAAAMRPTPVTDTQFVEEEDYEEEEEAAPSEPSLVEQEFAPQPGPLERVAPGVLRQHMPLTKEEQARFKQGLPKTLGQTVEENPFGEFEELLPPAAPPPAAVDKTAASVSAEQKGVPTDAPKVIGARTDARIAQMEADQPVSTRDLGNQAERMTAPAEYQKGERTDLLGFDDEEGFSRKKLIERVQQLYGEESAPERRWEDEFIQERGGNRMTDDQIRRRGAVIGFLGGAFEGDSSSGARWADQQHGANRSYEEGRARARDRDQSNRRISRGMAEAIAATGQVSPEAAVQLRMNDSLVKNFGQYASAGGRAEGQGMGLSREKLKIISRLVESGTEEDMKTVRAMLSAATQIDTAEAYAGRGKPLPVDPNDPNAVVPPTQRERAINAMSRRMRVDKETAARYMAGDYSGLPAEQARVAENMRVDIARMVNDEKEERTVGADVGKVETAGEAKVQFAVEQSVKKAQADPQYRTKFITDWTVARNDFATAWTGWQELSPDGKAALAKWAAGGWTGKIRSFLMQPGDQARIARVQGVINALVKDRSGAAVTGSEWERIATEIGIEYDNWNPWNSPDAIEGFLMRTGDRLKTHRQVFDQEIGWEKPHVR